MELTGFSRTHGTRQVMQVRIMLQVERSCRLPFSTFSLSESEIPGMPNRCVFDRIGPHEDPRGPCLARDHDLHSVAIITPRIAPHRIQPRKSLRVHGRVRSNWEPLTVSKGMHPKPSARRKAVTPASPEYRSRKNCLGRMDERSWAFTNLFCRKRTTDWSLTLSGAFSFWERLEC